MATWPPAASGTKSASRRCLELRIRRPDGEYRSHRLCGAVTRDPSGHSRQLPSLGSPGAPRCSRSAEAQALQTFRAAAASNPGTIRTEAGMQAALSAVVEFPAAAAREAVEDARAVAAAARGDRRAFERLYRQHVGRVHALCLRLAGHRETAEDCGQEAFVSAGRALPTFEARSQFSTWLHRIAVNSVLARQRGLAARLERTAA